MAKACRRTARQRQLGRALRAQEERKAILHSALRTLAGEIVLQPTVRKRSLHLMRAGATPRLAVRPMIVRPTPLRMFGAGSMGALSIGAMSLGAGAMGALVIGRIAIKRGVIGSLQIDDLKVGSLEVEELSIRRGSQPSGPPAH